MNSSFQSKNYESNLSRHCVHTKHVYSLMDTPVSEEAYKKLSKHLETCSLCSDELQKFKTKTAAVQIYIPKALMDHDLRQSFEREVGELFKVMELNSREILKRNVKKGFHFIDSLGLEFIKNLASKTMLKAYVMAAFIFVVLKLFM